MDAPDGHGPPDQPACASVVRSAGGGNPDAHLTIAITLSAGGCGEGRGLAIYEGFSTDAPLTDANYTFTFDARRLAAELFVEQGALLLVRQGTTIYESTGYRPISTLEGVWGAFTFSGTLRADRFQRTVGSGPLLPDFSGHSRCC